MFLYWKNIFIALLSWATLGREKVCIWLLDANYTMHVTKLHKMYVTHIAQYCTLCIIIIIFLYFVIEFLFIIFSNMQLGLQNCSKLNVNWIKFFNSLQYAPPTLFKSFLFHFLFVLCSAIKKINYSSHLPTGLTSFGRAWPVCCQYWANIGSILGQIGPLPSSYLPCCDFTNE